MSNPSVDRKCGNYVVAIKNEIQTVHDFSVGDKRPQPPARRSLNRAQLIRVTPVLPPTKIVTSPAWLLVDFFIRLLARRIVYRHKDFIVGILTSKF